MKEEGHNPYPRPYLKPRPNLPALAQLKQRRLQSYQELGREHSLGNCNEVIRRGRQHGCLETTGCRTAPNHTEPQTFA